MLAVRPSFIALGHQFDQVQSERYDTVAVIVECDEKRSRTHSYD